MNCQLSSLGCMRCPRRKSVVLGNKISGENIRPRQGYGGRVGLYSRCHYFRYS